MNDALAERQDRLLDWFRDTGRVAVAFSAGVDSTVVAKAARLARGNEAVAVTASSPSLASGELDEARSLAEQIGIQHVVVETEEFDDPNYVANPTNRCYFCKTELYTRVAGMRDELGVDVIVNGANLDDRGDHRPGMIAADEHGVRSPLIECGFTKNDVRDLARHWDLPVWDKPATPCLSSRVAYGLEVTPERLRRIDAAERFLRETFGLRELRVRHEPNDLARIEVPTPALPRLVEAREPITEHLQSLGFRYVTLDLAGFRSGSMNEVLTISDLVDLTD